MKIQAITEDDKLWLVVAEFAKNCSWGAGVSLAQQMSNGHFSDWEKVFVALNGEHIAGYCTLAKTDCIPNVSYTPYIGYIFVDECYRGKRLSEQLIRSAMEYANELGFDKVYLVSDHKNMYEKYGFQKIDEKVAPWGRLQTIFMHLT